MKRVLFSLAVCLLTWIVIVLYWIPQPNQTKIPMKASYPKFFFVETSGSKTLNPRQACAVESTARHHPLSRVTVIMLSPNMSHQTVDLFRSLPNAHIVVMTLDELFLNSPLEGWYKKGDWKRSKHLLHHLSDAIRLLVVWTYGGIYLDLDVVILKSLYHMKMNFLISEGHGSVANGMLAFEPHHLFISACLSALPKYYKPDCFACAGPPMITMLVKSFCSVKSPDEVDTSNCSIAIYPPITAFPVKWTKWRDYFDKTKTTKVLRAANYSHMVHVWNKSSGKQLLSLNSGSAYEAIVQQQCPSVYGFVASNQLNF